MQTLQGNRTDRGFLILTVGGSDIWKLPLGAVRPGPNAGLSFGAAAKLNVPPLGERHRGTIYDVSLDGRRVYFPHTTGRVPPREFGVVLGWKALIK